MSPMLMYHATHRKRRDSIRQHGLLPNRPQWGRPCGVYVFNNDLRHPTFKYHGLWTKASNQDLWQVTYIGPAMEDEYIGNALILLGEVDNVTLVSGN